MGNEPNIEACIAMAGDAGFLSDAEQGRLAAELATLRRTAREADTLRAALGESMVLLEALEAAEREADLVGGLHPIAPALRGELQAAIVAGREALGIGTSREADHA